MVKRFFCFKPTKINLSTVSQTTTTTTTTNKYNNQHKISAQKPDQSGYHLSVLVFSSKYTHTLTTMTWHSISSPVIPIIPRMGQWELWVLQLRRKNVERNTYRQIFLAQELSPFFAHGLNTELAQRQKDLGEQNHLHHQSAM